MKKRKIVFKVVGLLLFLSLIFVVLGCEKEPVLEPTYTVNITCDTNKGMVTPFGEIKDVKKDQEIEITINPKFGFKGDSVIVDGVKSPLASNIYFSLINKAKNSNVEVIFTKTLSWYAMQGAWNKDSLIIKENDGTWTHHLSSSKDSVFFLPTGRYNTYRNGKLIGDGNWSISESTIPATFNDGGFIWTIEELNSVSLILSTNDFKHIYTHH